MIETMKVKPWGKDQGEYVLINLADFDPKIHTPFEAEGGKAPSAHRLDPPAAKSARKRKAK